jgi:hypothetical protein
LGQPGERASHRQGAPGFWSRISQIFSTTKAPARTGSQPYGVRRGGPSGGSSF